MKKKEPSTIGQRVRRYAKVSSAATGLGLRMAGQKYLGLDIDKPAHARQLMESLGELKGPLLKIAQLLSTIPEALPKEYVLELQKLQSQAPPMGWPFASDSSGSAGPMPVQSDWGMTSAESSPRTRSSTTVSTDGRTAAVGGSGEGVSSGS